jgi:hypothetical protein
MGNNRIGMEDWIEMAEDDDDATDMLETFWDKTMTDEDYREEYQFSVDMDALTDEDVANDNSPKSN